MTPSHFSLFGLTPQFELDISSLESQHRTLTARFHPDRFASASAFEQKQAVMMSAAINEAYRILRSPIDRAAYLLELQGIHADAPEHTSFAPEFLMQQMQWRETLMDAKMEKNSNTLNDLATEIQQEHQQLLQDLNQAFIQQNTELAADLVRRGRFLHKMQQEVKAALSA